MRTFPSIDAKKSRTHLLLLCARYSLKKSTQLHLHLNSVATESATLEMWAPRQLPRAGEAHVQQLDLAQRCALRVFLCEQFLLGHTTGPIRICQTKTYSIKHAIQVSSQYLIVALSPCPPQPQMTPLQQRKRIMKNVCSGLYVN